APGAEQVDLEDQRVQLVVLIEQMLERRVGNDTTVPEVIRPDLDHRQRRRQRAARHDVLELDHFLGVIAINKVPDKTLTAPTEKRVRCSLMSEKSTSSSKLSRSGALS